MRTMSIYHFQLPDKMLEIRSESGRDPKAVLEEWVQANHPTETDIYGEYIIKEASYCGEVIESPQSVCLSPWSEKAMKEMKYDPEVVVFAKQHGIEITDEDSYQYACHIFDKVYDAGCMEG